MENNILAKDYSLVLIIGCMFASKSTETNKKIDLLDENNIPYKIFKPKKDTRNDTCFCTHDGDKTKAIPIYSLKDLRNEVEIITLKKNPKPTIVVDELQFFDENCIKYLVYCAKKGIIDLIGNGLDRNYMGEIFGFQKSTQRMIELYGLNIKHMGDLEKHATEIVRLKANCVDCGTNNTAEYSFYTELAPKGKKEQDLIVIGGKDVYKPLCRDCYIKAMDEKGYDIRNIINQ